LVIGILNCLSLFFLVPLTFLPFLLERPSLKGFEARPLGEANFSANPPPDLFAGYVLLPYIVSFLPLFSGTDGKRSLDTRSVALVSRC